MKKNNNTVSAQATIADLRKAIKIAEDHFPGEFRDDIKMMRRELARRVNHPSVR